MPLAGCLTVAQAASPLYKYPVDIPGLGKVQGVAALNSSVADYVDNWANISFFGGIPFGANRFAPPQPVAPWNITLDASTFGPICPTSNQQISTYPMSEDCLSVNIWTPATSADDKLPVAFWSYGDGTAAPQAQFNGGGVAGKGIVFVTYNYRNGALGFVADPSLPEVTGSNATGNWGVLDQYLALKWAHDNMAAFGGDPDHITVMGQSFGSAATFHIVNSNLTTSLGIRDRTLDEALEIGAAALADLNVTTVDEARALSYETILASTGTEDQEVKPVLDYYAIPDKYIASIRHGAANKVPYITGNNAGEYGVSNTFTTTTDDYISYVEGITGDLNATFLAVYPADNDTQASTSQIALVRDQSTVSSWQAMDGFSNSSGATTYTYYWNYAPPNDGSASHGSEIPYALGNLWAQAGVNYTSEDFYVANVLSSYWANFIKTSDPNSGDSYNNGTLPAIWKPNSVVGKTTFKVGAAYENIGVAGSDAKIQAFLEWFAVTPAI
ncbi:hypothetical protein PENARI_c012G08233 [Penicillium arizonense]|uniref:Carboxylesterase type B domain-containing protein n=1 Tax=Penicillium arizonense TaxID=1835702 RepID=A0A1F5LF73_PENAI|nr:hypothetical protein PENARI_c012G08233 [Penicillium arizonense]OGE51873.1 hypothetical protein PENARI_c012G08233 [Penicillium arizonense]